MEIRISTDQDVQDVLNVERRAFGDDQGAEIEELVANLLQDPTAKPLLSLLAYDNGKPVGHILFTHASILGPSTPLAAMLLAPLAVVPEAQAKGLGGKLIAEGLQLLAKDNTQLVFVLGHPDYYPRHGFKPAGALGFEATYPILEINAGAWMVLELADGIIGTESGKVMCAKALDKPQYWQE